MTNLMFLLNLKKQKFHFFIELWTSGDNFTISGQSNKIVSEFNT